MIDHLDHLVLTTRNKARCIQFYTAILGMRLEQFGAGRSAFVFGAQKINLHEFGKEFEPKAQHPTPGSLDLCFISTWPLEQVIARLQQFDIAIEEGPIKRTGATGAILSVYVRDPDHNLIEISNSIA